MVVGDNELTATKNADESLAISMAMAMQRYDARRIARWSTSSASLEATGCRHLPLVECLRRIALAAAMVDNFSQKHKTLTKTIFS